jgi:hypothetical protein
LARANIPLFFTNHVYADMGGGPYAQDIQAGGKGAIYSSSQILTLSKAQDKDADGSVNGVVITVTNSKARLTKEKLKIKCLVRFDSGLDRYYWLTEIAEAAGIFKKVSTKYQLPDGKTYFGKTIKENPEKFFTEDVLKQIDEWTQKNFMYGGSGDETLINAAFDGEE